MSLDLDLLHLRKETIYPVKKVVPGKKKGSAVVLKSHDQLAYDK